MLEEFICGRGHRRLGEALLIHADCFAWMSDAPEASVHAIVTDPPYGVKEYEADQLEKRSSGAGGIWRIPPSFDGANRQPLPRFTALNAREREGVANFFRDWSRLATRMLRPGGHVFLACNAFLCQLVYSAIVDGGLEFRGQIIRTVTTLRGGDRPKNAEAEFPDTCSLPRGGYEPWGLFRKPLPVGMTVGQCLQTFETGALRRLDGGAPFMDLIASGRTSAEERAIVNHPSLKPQAFLRELVLAALPLDCGIILDPFMGSGSTVAAAKALHRCAIGVERNDTYFELAQEAVPKLAARRVNRDQMVLALP